MPFRAAETARNPGGESLIAAGGIGAFSMLLILPSFLMPIAGLLISRPPRSSPRKRIAAGLV